MRIYKEFSVFSIEKVEFYFEGANGNLGIQLTYKIKVIKIPIRIWIYKNMRVETLQQ